MSESTGVSSHATGINTSPGCVVPCDTPITHSNSSNTCHNTCNASPPPTNGVCPSDALVTCEATVPETSMTCLDLKDTCLVVLVDVDLKDEPGKDKGAAEGTKESIEPMRIRVDSVNTVVLDGFADMSETNRLEVQGRVDGMDTRRALLSLIAIFLVSLSALAFVYQNFPQLDQEEYQYIKLPRDIEDAKNLGGVLSHYKNRYYLEVLAGVFVTYIFLQTFAIPGSIFLSILSGFLFRWEVALLVICFCSATGASFCYLLSYLAGRPVVLKYFPERTKSWQEKVDKQRDNLLFYIIFLRITPLLPNWFINITSPVINVPLMPFWLGTFLGVAPPSILAVQAGTTLYELTSSRDAFSLTSVVLLGLAACLSLVPILLKNRLREKFD